MKRAISIMWFGDQNHCYCPVCGKGVMTVEEGKNICSRCNTEMSVWVGKPIEKAHSKSGRK